MKYPLYFLLALALPACYKGKFEETAARNKALERANSNLRTHNDSLQRYIDRFYDFSATSTGREHLLFAPPPPPPPPPEDGADLNSTPAPTAEVAGLRADLAARDQRIRQLEAGQGNIGAQLAQFEQKLNVSLQNLRNRGLEVYQKEGRIHISVAENMLFESADKQLNAEAVHTVQQLADALKGNRDFWLLVEGHTDNVPVSNLPGVRDNWDLSALRAAEVVRSFAAQGLPQYLLLATGRGASVPVAPNDTESNRYRNRRTEIVLLPRLGAFIE